MAGSCHRTCAGCGAALTTQQGHRRTRAVGDHPSHTQKPICLLQLRSTASEFGDLPDIQTGSHGHTTTLHGGGAVSMRALTTRTTAGRIGNERKSKRDCRCRLAGRKWPTRELRVQGPPAPRKSAT
jgi:hypothetical protein